MKVAIEVKDRKEAEQIRNGLLDPTTRALVKISAALAELPSDAARKRVLDFVSHNDAPLFKE